MSIKTDAQTGFGLLELLLVLVIAALLLIMSIRLYEAQKMQNNIEQSKKYAELLLHATSDYYYAYCIKNVYSNDQIDKARNMLIYPTLSVDSLQSKDNYSNQFLGNDVHILFPFGTFDDGEMYHINLIHSPYSKNYCANSTAEGPQNCFGQTQLFQIQVSACVKSFTTVSSGTDKKPHYNTKGATAIKSMFQADSVSDFDTSSCQKGYVVTWAGTPDSQQNNYRDSGEALLSADQKSFNQMYRYGPWMQQGPLSEKFLPRLEYLCQ